MLKDLLKKLFPDKEKEIESLEIPEIKPEAKSEKKDESKEAALEELKTLVKTQQAEIQKLLKELSEVKEKEVANQKLLEDKAKKEKQEQIESLIKKAIEDLKIPAKNEELINKYKSLLEKDFESGKVIIDNLPKLKEEKSQSSGSGSGSGSSPVGASKVANKILQNILETNQINN